MKKQLFPIMLLMSLTIAPVHANFTETLKKGAEEHFGSFQACSKTFNTVASYTANAILNSPDVAQKGLETFKNANYKDLALAPQATGQMALNALQSKPVTTVIGGYFGYQLASFGMDKDAVTVTNRRRAAQLIGTLAGATVTNVCATEELGHTALAAYVAYRTGLVSGLLNGSARVLRLAAQLVD